MKAACPHCGQHYEIPQEDLGCTAECSRCGKNFVIQMLQEKIIRITPSMVKQKKIQTAEAFRTAEASPEKSAPAMRRLTCEMCGSTDLLKQDGVFVCQSCGTKYSLEEAKKMLDGAATVSISYAQSLERAKALFAQKRYDSAKEEISKYLRENPTDVNALILEVRIIQSVDVLAALKTFINLVPMLDSPQMMEQMADSLINDAVALHDKYIREYDTIYKAGETYYDFNRLLEYSLSVIISFDDLYSESQRANASNELLRKLGEKLCRIYKINSRNRRITSDPLWSGHFFGWNATDLQKATEIFNKYNPLYPTANPQVQNDNSIKWAWVVAAVILSIIFICMMSCTASHTR